jgi:hypothetical protein
MTAVWAGCPSPSPASGSTSTARWGVLLWPIALLFGLYAVTAGRPRLRQPANALALLALVLAVGSGKLMQEDWLRDGSLDHLVYSVHLLAWLLIALALILHVSAVLQRARMAPGRLDGEPAAALR